VKGDMLWGLGARLMALAFSSPFCHTVLDEGDRDGKEARPCGRGPTSPISEPRDSSG
jgi:hypothetical protein